MKNHQPTPVFIVGSGRSGTTITASLLNRLPGVHIAKETGFIGQNFDLLQRTDHPESLNRLVDVVNSWLTSEQWEQRATAEGFHNFCSRWSLKGGAAFVHYVWQLESKQSWGELQFIGDNTPLYVTCIPMLQQLFPNARFIHLVRDPRDVVCSIAKMRFGAADHMAAAMDWNLMIGCWLMAERTIAESSRVECRYEDLCISPEDTLAKLAAFLGRDRSESDAILTSFADAKQTPSMFEKVATLSHHARIAEPLNGSRVARYKAELTTAQIQQLECILQNGMRAFGYEFTDWQVSPLMKNDHLFILRAMLRDALKRCWQRITR
jgi:hypothetical protein